MQTTPSQQQDTNQNLLHIPDNPNTNAEDKNDSDNPNTNSTAEAQAYETAHVHNVYNEIASHFSQTRYKPWPIVSSFLRSQTPGSVGLDVGCGNGKYLAENGHVFILASDMSEPLLRLALEHHGLPRTKTPGAGGMIVGEGQAAQNETLLNAVLLSSTLNLPHPLGRFDFAISIAVIHHLSTRERRVEGIREILSCLRSGTDGVTGAGKALFYVWALEQQSSRRGWDATSEQDVMVPWVLTPRGKQDKAKQEAPRTYQRYYHLYRKGELESDVLAAGGRVLDAGYEKDNWWVIAVMTT